jgi:mRNA (guanine-N7-)-methyltransferase
MDTTHDQAYDQAYDQAHDQAHDRAHDQGTDMPHNTAAAHYDGTAAHSLRRTPLNAFHNDAKRALLRAFAAGAGSVLDVACGRGGDVHKWIALSIPHVTGLDVSSASVEEARRRSSEALARARHTFTHTFVVADLLAPWPTAATTASFDVVTCMFALHYFFATEASARAFLGNVAAALRPGGRFVGVVTDARAVNECLARGRGDTYATEAVTLRARWHGTPQCFGSAYTCDVRGTVTEASAVPEYLVWDPVLTKVAALAGLVPLAIDLPDVVDPAPPGGALHALRPPYDGPLAECSRLYAAFAFEKRQRGSSTT